jgi:hypothetical protein
MSNIIGRGYNPQTSMTKMSIAQKHFSFAVAVAALASIAVIADAAPPHHAGAAHAGRSENLQVLELLSWVPRAQHQSSPAGQGRGDRRLVGRWRFQKYGPLRGEFEFLSDGTYRYFVEDGTLRLAHEGQYTMRQPSRPVTLRGLLGILALTPQRIIARNAPSRLMIDSTVMDNDQPREYFVQDNLSPQHTQGVSTLSLCDVGRDWPGCAQTTRLYRVEAP